MSGRADGVRPGSGLSFRFYFLVAIGVLVPAIVVSAVSFARLRRLDQSLLFARVDAAEAVAQHIDEALRHDLEVLQRIASSARVDLLDRDARSEREILRQSYRQFHFVGGVFIVDARGAPLAQEPERAHGVAPPPTLPELREVLRTGKPQISSLVVQDGERRVYALVSVMDWQGRVVGAVGGILDPSLHRHATMLHHALRGFGGFADVVDGNGIVLASTDRKRHMATESCAPHLAALARDRRAEAGTCRGCHGARVVPWVLAFAPLSTAPWGVAVLQPEEEVLATSRALPRDFPLYAIGILAVAGVFAWGAARSVIRPVGVLTVSAERIARGELERPIPALGGDEIGRLGSSLEHMRTSLRDLMAYRQRYQHELEARVVERTTELARANEQLREREEARARLLHMVITAQEDERKRIARELHDDTSQNLAVLVMGIESAIHAIRSGGPTPRLEEVKALAVHALEEVHRMIHDLRPSVLDDLGLFSAIRWYAERHVATRGIAVRCELPGQPEPRLPAAYEIALFRICQEALNNVVRHAHAESVLVQVNAERGELRIEIEDDGRGFDRSAARADERAHWGLLGIEERAQILGGEARIDSAPGHGTRVDVRVPLPPPAPAGDPRGEGT
jgi:signal transduction histidine kinase